MNAIQTKIKDRNLDTRKLLNLVLQEIRSLRHEFSLLLPYDDLEEYEHTARIKRSYKKQLKNTLPLNKYTDNSHR
jgi:hypothetical protein